MVFYTPFGFPNCSLGLSLYDQTLTRFGSWWWNPRLEGHRDSKTDTGTGRRFIRFNTTGAVKQYYVVSAASGLG